MTTLTDFLLARIAEDEAFARSAIDPERPGMRWRWERTLDDLPVPSPTWEDMPVALRSVEQFPTTSGVGALPDFPVDHLETDEPRALPHIARHDPARVLAECEAKRRIIGTRASFASIKDDGDMTTRLTAYGTVVGLDLALQHLAQPYADHPDYNPEWNN